MTDRYTKCVLTVIAVALVYLCVIFTPLPHAHAQTSSIRPGESSGPTEVVVVGWEENATREKMTGMAQLSDDDQWSGFRALPVKISR